jgi:hypothetical protein
MIDKLEFVIALAREQHFGRAAETYKRQSTRIVGRHQAT